MDKVIAVFNNRNHSMQFANYLKRMGVQSKTISTPRELSVSCGLSVLFSYSNLKQAEYVLKNYRFSGFVRFFKVSHNNAYKKYIPI